MKIQKYLSLIILVNFAFGQLKSPEEVFGFKVGSDYKLADYNQMLTFHRQLAKKFGQGTVGRNWKDIRRPTNAVVIYFHTRKFITTR